MSGPVAALLLLGLLWVQMLSGTGGILGVDWTLCGLLVLCVRMRPSACQISAVGLGLLRDVFSVVPLGAQALGLGITAGVVRFLGNQVFLESFWIQGILFFFGYLFYQLVFFSLGRTFGFLNSGFWDIFAATIPKAVFAAVICWLLLLGVSRFSPGRSDL